MARKDENGVISLSTDGTVHDVSDRLVVAVMSHGMRVFARIDQAAAARDAGIEMGPMELILFGNPAAGTPLMVAHPTLAIDLPLKAVVWEDGHGVVWISYNSSEYLQQRHGLPAPPFGPVAALIESTV